MVEERNDIHSIGAARDDEGRAIGLHIVFSGFDTRTFADVLLQWQGTKPTADFIREDLDLEGSLSIEDYTQLVTTADGVDSTTSYKEKQKIKEYSAAPGELLAGHIAVRLPTEIMTLRKFYNRADKRREKASATIEIDKDVYLQKRGDKLAELLDNIVASTRGARGFAGGDEEERQESDVFYKALKKFLKNVVRENKIKDFDIETSVENISREVGITPENILGSEPLPKNISIEEASARLSLLLAGLVGPEKFDKTYEQFKEFATEYFTQLEKTGLHLGMAVRFLREGANMWQRDVSDVLGRSEMLISHWETGRTKISPLYLGGLTEAFSLSKDAMRSMEDAFKEIDNIKTQKLLLLRKEALESEDRGSFGRLLASERILAGFTQQNIADVLQVTNSSVSNWENRALLTSPDKINAIADALGLEEERRQQFIDKYEATKCIGKRIKEADTAEVARLEALESTDRGSFGKLLASERILAGFTQQNIADVLNITKVAVSRWERAKSLPSPKKINAIADMLGLEGERREEFISKYNTTREHKKIEAEGARLEALESTDRGSFGKLLASERIISGFTRQKIADVLQVTMETVRSWERGKSFPSSDRVGSIVGALGLEEERREEVISRYNTIRGHKKIEAEEARLEALKSTDQGSFGRLLASERILAELTQQNIADVLQVTNSSVAVWEKGRSLPSQKKVDVIADTLGLGGERRQQFIDKYESTKYPEAQVTTSPGSKVEEVTSGSSSLKEVDGDKKDVDLDR